MRSGGLAGGFTQRSQPFVHSIDDEQRARRCHEVYDRFRSAWWAALDPEKTIAVPHLAAPKLIVDGGGLARRLHAEKTLRYAGD